MEPIVVATLDYWAPLADPVHDQGGHVPTLKLKKKI